MRLRAVVPAASGNLGSGFDSAGVALALYNEVLLDTEEAGVRVLGEGEGTLPVDSRNACVWAMQQLAERCRRQLPGFGLELHNRIPIGRGLASSGAAVLAGLLLANLLLDQPCSRSELIALGTELEGHPDNVAAAMLGGVVVSAWDGSCVHAVRLQPPVEMSTVVWVPELELVTKRARAALPETVSMQDAVFNLSRSALFAAAFATQCWDQLAAGVEDRLHQPYRAPLVPGLYEIIRASEEAGAVAACLSGAGPSVIALCLGDPTAVEAAVRAAARPYGEGRVLLLGMDLQGAYASRV